jgi:hypothetical protein
MEKQKELYEQHKCLINKEVWTACRKFPSIPHDDILSDAHEIFCKCCRKWKPEKTAKFSTYLTQALRNAFKPYYYLGSQSILDNDGFDPEKVGVNGMCGPERLVRLKQALAQMKPLAIEVVNLVFTFPTELESATKQGLRNYLRKVGWSNADMISEAFLEIKQTLKEV